MITTSFPNKIMAHNKSLDKPAQTKWWSIGDLFNFEIDRNTASAKYIATDYLFDIPTHSVWNVE